MEDIVADIQQLVIMQRQLLLDRLRSDQRIPSGKLDLLENFTEEAIRENVKVILLEDFIGPTSVDLAKITWTEKIKLVFVFDRLTQSLWLNQPAFIGLVEHELLHLPTRYDKVAPLFLQVPIYIPTKNTYEDYSRIIEDYMKDVFVDKFMTPTNLEAYYDLILFHQLLVFEYLTTLQRKHRVLIWAIKKKAASYLKGEVVTLDFIYPWPVLFHHLFLYTVTKYHHLQQPLLDEFYRAWMAKCPYLVQAISQLYEVVVNQTWWQSSYISELRAIQIAMQRYGYMEMDFSIPLQASPK
jgi:hypothetical protein